MQKTNVVNFRQQETVYKTVNEIIEHLDEHALNELFSGYKSDEDALINIFIQETEKALYGYSPGIVSSQFHYLEKLTEEFDYQLKRLVLNYFIATTMPEFELSWHHLEWGSLTQLYRFLTIIAARGHGKSYFFSKAVPLWHLFRYNKEDFYLNHKYGIHLSQKGLIITAEYKLAILMMEEIMSEVESNDYLQQHIYPDRSLRSSKWGAEQISSKHGASLQIRSYGSKMRGLHPGWVMVDDFLTDAALYSSEQRMKYITYMHSVIINLLEPGGQIVVVGTPFHQQDLYADLKEKPGWKVFEYPAIFPDGTVLWPTKFNLDALTERLDAIGSLNFSREILVRPVSGESSIFPYEIVKKAFDKNYTLVPNIVSAKQKFDQIIIGTDFAISSSAAADSTSFVVLGQAGDVYWVLEIFLGKGLSYDAQMSKLKQMHYNFASDKIIIETNGMQKIFYQMGEEAGLPVIDHPTGKDKWSLEKGLPALSVLFETHRMKLPRGDQRSKDLTDILAGELSSYTFDSGKIVSTSGHSDVGMALWQAVLGVKYYGRGFNFSFLES